MIKIKIHRSENNKQYWVTIHGRNGKIVFTSETYKRLAGAEKAARLAKYFISTCDIIYTFKRRA